MPRKRQPTLRDKAVQLENRADMFDGAADSTADPKWAQTYRDEATLHRAKALELRRLARADDK